MRNPDGKARKWRSRLRIPSYERKGRNRSSLCLFPYIDRTTKREARERRINGLMLVCVYGGFL